jgi:hypothetical protein
MRFAYPPYYPYGSGQLNIPYRSQRQNKNAAGVKAGGIFYW